MLKIDLYHAGGTLRARMHHHPGGADERCTDECYEYAGRRSYQTRHREPREVRQDAVALVTACLMTPEIGHAEFSLQAGEQLALF